MLDTLSATYVLVDRERYVPSFLRDAAQKAG